MRIGTVFLVCAFATSACGGSAASTGTTPATSDAVDQEQHDAFIAYYGLGMSLQESERCADALRDGYDPAIAAYESAHVGARIVGSRSPSSAPPGGGLPTPGYSAVDYAEALYLAGFCSVELGDLPRAEAYLRNALSVIDRDPLFQSELGHVQQARGEFEASIATFQAAVDRAREIEATEPGVTFLGMSVVTIRHRAMRGVGYSLGELRRFDEAEAIYRSILEEDPEDARSREELEYLAAQRN